MTHISTAANTDLTILNSRAIHLQERLMETTVGRKSTKYLERIAEAIARQLDLEKQTMEKIAFPLTPIHLEEHQKMLAAIALLEFSWKAKRISNEVYIKALNYKFEFHYHYFDKAQLQLTFGDHCNVE